jgi:hypothetical protein
MGRQMKGLTKIILGIIVYGFLFFCFINTPIQGKSLAAGAAIILWPIWGYNASNLVNIHYRVVQRNKNSLFEPQYLTLVGFIFPNWRPIEEIAHEYWTTNAVGMPTKDYFYTPVEYATLGLAKTAVIEHKNQMWLNRNKFWHPTKPQKKIIHKV